MWLSLNHRGRRGCSRYAVGLCGRQGDQKVPTGNLRAAERAEGRATNGEGEDGHRLPAQRFAGARGVYRQGRSTGSEQDVRVWLDPLRRVNATRPTAKAGHAEYLRNRQALEWIVSSRSAPPNGEH